jgi:hypothetical protein
MTINYVFIVCTNLQHDITITNPCPHGKKQDVEEGSGNG